MTKPPPPTPSAVDEQAAKAEQRAADIERAKRLIDQVFRDVFGPRTLH